MSQRCRDKLLDAIKATRIAFEAGAYGEMDGDQWNLVEAAYCKLRQALCALLCKPTLNADMLDVNGSARALPYGKDPPASDPTLAQEISRLLRRTFICPKCGEGDEGRIRLLTLGQGDRISLTCLRCDWHWYEEPNDAKEKTDEQSQG